MKTDELKKIIREAYQELIAEGKISKKKLDQTKDGKSTAGDAVVAARKSKIAASKGDKKGEQSYTKIKKAVNKHIVKETENADEDADTKSLKGAKVIMVKKKGKTVYLKLSKGNKTFDAKLT